MHGNVESEQIKLETEQKKVVVIALLGHVLELKGEYLAEKCQDFSKRWHVVPKFGKCMA